VFDLAWFSGAGNYRHVLQPNHVVCAEVFDPMPWIYGVRSGAYERYLNPPRSYHTSGVNVLFCDGSVRFVKETVERRTWRALGTRCGGEVVSASDY
jgi:prepilin-type processing-associated H-X9-DG protein